MGLKAKLSSFVSNVALAAPQLSEEISRDSVIIAQETVPCGSSQREVPQYQVLGGGKGLKGGGQVLPLLPSRWDAPGPARDTCWRMLQTQVCWPDGGKT